MHEKQLRNGTVTRWSVEMRATREVIQKRLAEEKGMSDRERRVLKCHNDRDQNVFDLLGPGRPAKKPKLAAAVDTEKEEQHRQWRERIMGHLHPRLQGAAGSCYKLL
jgi:hypothetical protein